MATIRAASSGGWMPPPEKTGKRPARKKKKLVPRLENPRRRVVSLGWTDAAGALGTPDKTARPARRPGVLA
jgi:hypothetical protein